MLCPINDIQNDIVQKDNVVLNLSNSHKVFKTVDNLGVSVHNYVVLMSVRDVVYRLKCRL